MLKFFSRRELTIAVFPFDLPDKVSINGVKC